MPAPAGFTRISPPGERFQHWSGAIAGLSVEYVWDSVGDRKYRRPDSIEIRAFLGLVACATITAELVQASTLGAAAKTAAIQAMRDALKED